VRSSLGVQISQALYTALMDVARTLTAAVSKDGEWYVARCLEVEVASQGETVDDALVNLREALELYFEDDEVPASFVHPLVTSIEIRIPA
jgi:predicted RNase H-like HicB family nuclease